MVRIWLSVNQEVLKGIVNLGCVPIMPSPQEFWQSPLFLLGAYSDRLLLARRQHPSLSPPVARLIATVGGQLLCFRLGRYRLLAANGTGHRSCQTCASFPGPKLST